MYQMLRLKNTWSAPRAVEFTQKLCQVKSVSCQESALADLVEHQMNMIGFDRVVRDSAGNVVGLILGRTGNPTVLLNSHMDTVDATGTGWRHQPLSGRISGGRLYGLGSSDCKSGLSAQLFVAELLKHSLLPLEGNLVVAATVAEENGMGSGVQTLIEQTLPELSIKPDYAILGEPTDMGLYYGHDGWIEMDITIEGSNPFQVDDAAEAVYEEMQADEGVSTLRPRFEQTQGRRRAVLQVSRRMAMQDDATTTVNQLRHEATRVAQSVGTLAVEVGICQETRQLYSGKTTVVRRATHAWMTDPFHPLIERSRQSLTAAGCNVRPGKWQLGKFGMGTAGGILVNQYKIPTIGYGPGEEAQAHAEDESVAVDSIGECVYGTAAIVHSLIGTPVFGWTTDEI